MVKVFKKLRDLPFFLSLFLLLALVVTVFFGLVFIVVHQVYRQSANDPQIQISEDMASYASAGKDLKLVIPGMVDPSKSLVWFVIFFDEAGKVIASNVELDGQVPVVPSGVLENAKAKGENRVTWEPKEGVRIASVVNKYNGGTVLVGRSLRETEDRIHMLMKKVFVVWVVSLVLVFVGSWLVFSRKRTS